MSPAVQAMRDGLDRYREEQRTLAIKTVLTYKAFVEAEAEARMAGKKPMITWADITIPSDSQYRTAREAGVIS